MATFAKPIWRAARQCRGQDFVPVEAIAQELLAAGLPVPRIVAGGTPTFPVHAGGADGECSPGTCIFWDASYAGKFPDLDFCRRAAVNPRDQQAGRQSPLPGPGLQGDLA